MPDSIPPLATFPTNLQAAYPAVDLLWGVLETSLTGLALYAPLRDAAGRLVDFRIDLFNAAAQRMLGQPAQPTGTYLECFPIRGTRVCLPFTAKPSSQVSPPGLR